MTDTDDYAGDRDGFDFENETEPGTEDTKEGYLADLERRYARDAEYFAVASRVGFEAARKIVADFEAHHRGMGSTFQPITAETMRELGGYLTRVVFEFADDDEAEDTVSVEDLEFAYDRAMRSAELAAIDAGNGDSIPDIPFLRTWCCRT